MLERRSFFKLAGALFGATATGLPLTLPQAKAELASITNEPLVEVPKGFQFPSSEFHESIKFPKLYLTNGAAKIVREGKAKEGTWVVIHPDGEVESLGKRVGVLPIEWHPKAAYYPEGKSDPYFYFDFKSAAFQKIMEAKYDLSIPSKEQWRYQAGIEFYVGIPHLEQVATFYCNTRTLKQFAIEVRHYLGNFVRFGRHKLNHRGFEWWSPNTKDYTPQFPFGRITKSDVESLRTHIKEGRGDLPISLLSGMFERYPKNPWSLRVES